MQKELILTTEEKAKLQLMARGPKIDQRVIGLVASRLLKKVPVGSVPVPCQNRMGNSARGKRSARDEPAERSKGPGRGRADEMQTGHGRFESSVKLWIAIANAQLLE
jgi:hypothetical protein